MAITLTSINEVPSIRRNTWVSPRYRWVERVSVLLGPTFVNTHAPK
jgi:hypothetical protein